MDKNLYFLIVIIIYSMYEYETQENIFILNLQYLYLLNFAEFVWQKSDIAQNINILFKVFAKHALLLTNFQDCVSRFGVGSLLR